MRVRVLVGTALALVAVAVVVTLSSRGAELTGTNHVLPVALHVVVPPGQQACQEGTLLPDDTGRVRLTAGLLKGSMPVLSARFTTAGGRLVAQGRSRGGEPPGTITVALADPVDGDRATRMCIRNQGGGTVALGSDIASPDSAARVRDKPTEGLVAVTFLKPAATSWWAELPGLTDRFGLGKASFFGSWTLPVAALLLLGAWIAAVRLLLRELSR